MSHLGEKDFYDRGVVLAAQREHIQKGLFGGLPDEDVIQKAKGEGSRGGKVIGRTKSDKPIYDSASHSSHKNFTPDEHLEAAGKHIDKKDSLTKESDRDYHEFHAKEHEAEAKKKKENPVKHKVGDKVKDKAGNTGKVTHSNDEEVSVDYDKSTKEGVDTASYKHHELDSVKKAEEEELIDEHKRLVDVLDSPSHEDDKEESKKQKKELEELEKKKVEKVKGDVNDDSFDKGGQGSGRHIEGGDKKSTYNREKATSESNPSHYPNGDKYEHDSKAGFDDHSRVTFKFKEKESGVQKAMTAAAGEGVTQKESVEHNPKDTQNPKASDLKKAYEVLGLGDLIEKAEGARGGEVIGHTESGKPIYKHNHVGVPMNTSHYQKFTSKDHRDAAKLYQKRWNDANAKGASQGERGIEGSAMQAHTMQANKKSKKEQEIENMKDAK